MYLNVNFNVFFKLIKLHLLVSELYICRGYFNVNFNIVSKTITFALVGE